MIFRPLLAADAPEDLAELKFPVLISPKLDGVRCLIRGGKALGRSLDPIPNRYVQELLAGLPDGLDGELVVGQPYGPDVLNRTVSGLRSIGGRPKFTYYVFDNYRAAGTFSRRSGRLRADPYRSIIPVRQQVARTPEEILAFEKACLAVGFEGIVIRDPDALYKHGRSTTLEGGLLRLVRWKTIEVPIVEVTERCHNASPEKPSALGLKKRFRRIGDQIPMGTTGALVCVLNGVRFKVAISDSEVAAEFWKAPPLGKLAKVKFKGLTPAGKPRQPVFLGIREKWDLSKENVAC